MPFVNAPDFYQDLYRFVKGADRDLTQVNASGYAFSLTKTGHCIDTRSLTQAASKFLLAERVQGLSIVGYAPGSETPENYSAQVIMALSVVAFESYCRIFSKKWHEVYSDIISEDVACRYNEIFSQIPLDADFFGRLKRAQDDKRGADLQTKIEKFENGNSKNLYAVAVGFRNAFSHGKLGTLAGTRDVGECLRSFVLEAIRDDCSRRYGELIF